MVLDLTGFKITQTSAKDGNREIGVRAHDAGHTELLSFLFLTPEYKKQTPATCLQQDLQQIRKDNGRFAEQLNPFNTDDSETSTIALAYPTGDQVLYKYAGSGDQCLVIQVYADKGNKLNLAKASTLLSRQHYDPRYLPTAEDVAQYQGIRGRAIMVSAKPSASTSTPKMLVNWHGLGGILLPKNPEWKLSLLTAYDKAARPAAQFKNDTTDVVISFIIFENLSGNPTSEGCRKDVIDGIHKQEGAIISNSIDGTMSDGHGGRFATASHLTQLPGGNHNHDVFAFSGNKTVCAEAHASTVAGKPDEDKRLSDAIAEFHSDLSYHPDWLDYFGLATALYNESPMLAAPFFDSSLKEMPSNPTDPTPRRLATDVVIVALERMGNLKSSRGYAERAIKSDPNYPMTYYHLACIDAEEGKAKDAKLHLQQAFDRKANAVPGEAFPDPTKDDSILKLKKDKDFWAFVQTLR